MKPYFRGLFTSCYWGGGREVPSHIHSQITDDPLSLDLTLGFFIPFYRRIWSFFYNSFQKPTCTPFVGEDDEKNTSSCSYNETALSIALKSKPAQMQSWVFFPHPTGTAAHLMGKVWLLRSTQRTLPPGEAQKGHCGLSPLVQAYSVWGCREELCWLANTADSGIFNIQASHGRDPWAESKGEDREASRGERNWGGRWGRWRSCNIVNSFWGTLNQGECQTLQWDWHTHKNPF